MALLYEKFGEFDSAEELNKAANGLKEEGDIESLKALFKENGLDPEDVEDYMDGMTISEVMAAVGKLYVESVDLGLPNNILISDWVGYIRELATGDKDIAIQVRRTAKSLAECIALIMTEAFKNQWNVPKDITDKAKLGADKITFGIPSEAAVKKIIKDYYGGKA